MAQIRGIDISHHQGAVNWNLIQDAVNRGELGFVILRAGYGGGGRDSQFARNWAEARARGIPRQAYFYAYPGRSSGHQQAADFFGLVGHLQPGESVSLDIEDDPTYGRRLNAGDVQWCLDFLNHAQALFGVKPLIYMNSDVLGRFDWSPVVKGDYGLWIANYGPNNGQPNGDGPSSGEWPFWAIWQFTSRGNVAGISPVDVNIFSGDKAAFLKYGRKGGSAPAPAPSPAPAPAPAPQPAPNTVQVVRPIPGYVTAADAAARKNSNSSVPPGTYAVFNRAQSMINITRQAGVPGWWINPGDLGGGAPVPKPAQAFHKVVPGDTNSVLAARYGTPRASGGDAVDQIVQWNRDKYPRISRHHIEVGWTLRVR